MIYKAPTSIKNQDAYRLHQFRHWNHVRPHLLRSWAQVLTPPPGYASASGCSHFRTRPSFRQYLAPIKFHDDVSNRSRVIALTNKQTDKHTYKQTLLKTIPPSLRRRCAGGKRGKQATWAKQKPTHFSKFSEIGVKNIFSQCGSGSQIHSVYDLENKKLSYR